MRHFTLLTCLFTLLAALPAGAQNCGCADQGNCPFTVPANSNTQVCYDIIDAFNNDLANPAQGVCGVSIHFRHQRISELDLTLTSPSGQQVQLTGTNGNCNPFTVLSNWDILFLPCGEICMPDTINNCPLPCIFDNCPNNCNWPNANMNGSYYPFSGCLEDFDFGPANGQWCLEIANGAQFNAGAILDFQIILCDNDGILCCEADAGNLAFEPDMSACEGDSILLLSPEPMYGATVPDTLEYGYTYTIFSNDTLQAYDPLTDLRNYPVGTYTVCGLSYLLADSLLLPAPGTETSPTEIDLDLDGPNPSFCGNIATNCIVVHISTPSPPTDLAETVCVGDTVWVGMVPHTETGMFSDTIVAPGGCDSIVNLTLTVLLPDTTMLVETICDSDSFSVGTQTFGSTGMFEVLLQNQFGCDSLVQLDLTVLDPIATSLTDTICLGDTLWVGNVPHAATGIFTDTLTSFFSCDSIVTLDLTVVGLSLSIAPADTLTCNEQQFNLSANASTTSGMLVYVWTHSSPPGTGIMSGSGTSTPTIDLPGTYTLTLISQPSGCSATSSVTVAQDVILPTANALAQAPDTLNCTVASVQLDGSTSSSNSGNLLWLWTTSNGNILPPANTPTAQVNQPGTYLLTVTDPANGCTGTDSVTIVQDIVSPSANAGIDGLLSCTAASVQLDGSASSSNSGSLQWLWTTSNGNILPPANIPAPQVDQPGTYVLTVTDPVNGCNGLDSVTVSTDTLSPMAVVNIPGPDTLTCAVTTVTLDGSASQNTQNASFEWLGVIASGQGTNMATVTQPGMVFLVVVDTINGCSDTAMATVDEYISQPIADAGMDGAVSCTNISEDIGGPGTTIGATISYAWTTTDGTFTSATDQPIASVDSAGTYVLTVTELVSGCSDADTVVIAGNFQPLIANAGPDGLLNCEVIDFLLDGSGSTLGGFIEETWVNSAGTVISTNPTVLVDYPDTFYLILELAACVDSDMVVVLQGNFPPSADAGPDQLLGCTSGLATLDGTGSDSGPDILYAWTTADGSIVSGGNTATATVGDVGTYVLTVTDSVTACTVTDTVLVALDTAACMPQIDAGADGTVDCFGSPNSTTLMAYGPTGTIYDYEWTPLAPPAQVFSTLDSLAPEVSMGTFVFSVTNIAVGLTAYDTVTVVADTMPPIASAGDFALPLTCPELASCYPLDVSGTSTGPGYSYFWVALDGMLCTDSTLLNAEVLGTGIYELEVTDLSNGCTATDAIIVQLEDFPPTAGATSPVQMPCGDSIAVLNGSAMPAGGNFNFQWFSQPGGGNILGGGNTLMPTVSPNNPQDTFFLVVQNNQNLCHDTAAVILFAPVNCNPACQASVVGQLDCNNTSVTLSANGSSTGPDISYQWVALSGNLCGGEMTPNACADAAGFYQLTVTRTYPNGAPFSTNCQVQVLDFNQPPVASAGPDDNLNCADLTLTLDGSGSSSGPGINYAWTTVGGNFFTGQMSNMPTIDLPGDYEILVTNTNTGCTATDMATIGLDTLHPTANAGPDDMLTCASNSVTLSGSGMPANVAYHWTTQSGNICGNANLPNTFACAAGTYVLTVTNPVNGCTAQDSATVTASSDVPMVNVGPDLYFTCADTVFTVNASASGQGSLQYAWTTAGGCIVGPSNVLQVTVNCPGSYTLTVTDQTNGCSVSSALQVIDDTAPPVANAGPTMEINCQNLQVQLDGSSSSPAGQLAFAWETLDGNILPPANTAKPTVDSAGTYTLIVTDLANQCRDTASVLVTIAAGLPNASAGPDTTLTCARLEVNLDGTGSTAGANIAYQWTQISPPGGGGIISGANGPSPTVNSVGIYVLAVTDNNSLCTVRDTVVVTLDLATPTAVIDPSGNFTLTCNDPTLPLNGSPSTPTGGVSWAWTTANGNIMSGANSAIATVNAAGTYSLTVTLISTGCKDVETISVNADLAPPFVQVLTPQQLTCARDSVQLTALPPDNQPIYDFQWSGPNILSGANTAMPTVGQAGVYFITITNTTNGCEGDSSVIVTQNLSPPVANASALSQLDCDNLMALVTGDGSTATGVTYAWTTTSGGTIATPNALGSNVDAPGWYFLTVKKLDNGCTATDSVLVTASSTPIENVFFTLTQPNCSNPEGTIAIDSVAGGTPPYFYQLDNDIFITFPLFNYLDPGPYQLSVEDVNGCAWTTEVAMLFPNDILLELGADLYIRQGESTTLEAQVSLPESELASVTWTGLPDSVACPDCLAQEVSPTETTTYRIFVTDSTGCRAEDRVTVFVDEQLPFYVPTAFSPNGDNANDRLLLYAGPDVLRVPSLRIFDRWGNLVFFKQNYRPNNPADGWDGNFEGQPMNPAVFVWKAEVEFADGEVEVFYGEVLLVR